MSEEQPGVNSRQYWEQRFADNWDEAGGPAQTRFFAQLALRMMPRWLTMSLSACDSFVDVGCAEGEAAALFKRQFPSLAVTGIDFSDKAIATARSRHEGVDFLVGDIARVGKGFEVVFCSNVLEHFHDPLSMLEHLVAASTRYVVVMVPGWEIDRHHEHHVTFTLSSFPRVVSGMQCLHVGAVNCARIDSEQWPGYQLMVVYGIPEAAGQGSPTLEDAVVEAQLPGLSIADLAALREFDPALERIGQLASDSLLGASAGSVVVQRIADLEQRQEQISFNTRHEIGERIATLSETLEASFLSKLEAAQSERVSALGIELELVKQETQALRRKAQASETSWREAQAKLAEEEEKRNEQAKASAHDHAALAAWRAFAVELEEDRQRLALEAGRLVEAMRETHRSRSWRVTAPLRWVSTALLGRAEPAPIRNAEALQPRRLSAPKLTRDVDAGSQDRLDGDLDWSEFVGSVLSQRSEYRGIFIQEMVIDWNVPLYQRPQHVATAFARLGYLVIYVTPQWGGDIVDGFRQIASNIWLTSRWEVNTIGGAVRSIYSTAYAHTPEQLAERPEDSVMLYEYIDHIDPQISGEGEVIESLLKLKSWAFSGGADLVVASARVLYAEAESAVGADKVVMVPNGVDTRHYRNPAQADVEIDPRLAQFCASGKPIVGYFGAIAPWLWYEEIEELVRARPDLGFVFIGPDYHGGVKRLPKADNVIYIGPVDYKVLPGHARLFDVCLIPFRPGEIARTTSPLKLFEYFALEKPVVVTSEMVECVAYPEVFRGATATGLSEALDAALASGQSPASRERLRILADENDWDKRVETLARAVELSLARRSL